MLTKRNWFSLVLALAMIVPVSAPALAGPPDHAKPADRAANVIRCVTIDQEVFCTEMGFMDLKPGTGPWKALVADAMAADVSGTGDMNFADLVTYLETLPADELRARQDEQISAARSAVGRIKLVDFLADNEEIPAGFFDDHPELALAESSPQARALRAAALDESGKGLLSHLTDQGVSGAGYDLAGEESLSVVGPGNESLLGAPAVDGPTYRYIIYNYYVQQSKNYYCGPATMDAIDWADDGGQNGQAFWAGSSYLRTDIQGATALSDLVNLTNTYTNWDWSSRGGSYAMVSVSGKSQTWFMIQHELRIGVYGAPIIEHVKLRNEYFTYLRYDHGGHFQTGRGYSYQLNTISIFEPYDERDWTTYGYATGKVQYVPVKNLYDATQIHPHKNMGA